MRKELEELLVREYPTLFKEYGGPMEQTCMAWGCSCGDGWFDLLKALCEELRPYPYLVVGQIKEKFGGLRFYLNYVDKDDFDAVYTIIHKYEDLSYTTCEFCGKPGKLTKGPWCRTLCDECYKPV